MGDGACEGLERGKTSHLILFDIYDIISIQEEQMKIKKTFTTLIISLAVISVLLAATNRTIQAQAGAPDPEIIKRLDEISATQSKILAEIAVIKEEIRVVKVRVTQNQ